MSVVCDSSGMLYLFSIVCMLIQSWLGLARCVVNVEASTRVIIFHVVLCVVWVNKGIADMALGRSCWVP